LPNASMHGVLRAGHADVILGAFYHHGALAMAKTQVWV
jgi:hypothetical protein